MDEAQCLSARSLRYGRNIMVICLIASGVKLFDADFTNAGLFGIKVQEQQFWAVLLFLLIWHLVYFVVLVYDDIRNWWHKNVSITYPSSKLVTYLGTMPKTITVDGQPCFLKDTGKNFEPPSGSITVNLPSPIVPGFSLHKKSFL